MWKRSDVDPNRSYCVALCQSSDGYRHFRLQELGSTMGSETVLVTQVVPMTFFYIETSNASRTRFDSKMGSSLA